MKILSLVLVALCSSLTSPASAQYLIGPRAGADIGTHHLSEDMSSVETLSWKTGGMGGIELDRAFTPHFSLELQVLFDQKGANAEAVPSLHQSTGTSTWTLNYLELPLLAKMSFGSGSLRPYVFAGPSFGFLRSARQHLHTEGEYNVPDGIGVLWAMDTTANLIDSTRKFDFSIVGGAGVNYLLSGGTQLYLDAGYAFGLTNFDNYSRDLAEKCYVYSRDIRISAGTLFPL